MTLKIFSIFITALIDRSPFYSVWVQINHESTSTPIRKSLNFCEMYICTKPLSGPEEIKILCICVYIKAMACNQVFSWPRGASRAYETWLDQVCTVEICFQTDAQRCTSASNLVPSRFQTHSLQTRFQLQMFWLKSHVEQRARHVTSYDWDCLREGSQRVAEILTSTAVNELWLPLWEWVHGEVCIGHTTFSETPPSLQWGGKPASSGDCAGIRLAGQFDGWSKMTLALQYTWEFHAVTSLTVAKQEQLHYFRAAWWAIEQLMHKNC